MDKREFNELEFEEKIEFLINNGANIYSYDTLKDYAKELIDEDDLSSAIHILEGLDDDQADYYDYDMSMGTLDQVASIEDEDDLEDIFDQLFSDVNY